MCYDDHKKIECFCYIYVSRLSDEFVMLSESRNSTSMQARIEDVQFLRYMMLSNGSRNCFKLQIEARVLAERLKKIVDSKLAIENSTSPNTDCLVPVGSSHFVKASQSESLRMLNNSRRRLLEKLARHQNYADLQSNPKTPADATYHDTEAHVEILEELNDNGDIVHATLNGKSIEELDISRFSSTKAPSFRASQTGRQTTPKRNGGEESTQILGELDSSHSNIIEFEVLAQEISDQANEGIPDASEYEKYIPNGANDLEDEFNTSEDIDSDDSYADNVLFGNGMSLIPANGSIEKRLKEELLKLGLAKKTSSPNCEKTVRFDDTLHIKTIDKGNDENRGKMLRFRRENMGDSIDVAHKSSSSDSVVHEDIVERLVNPIFKDLIDMSDSALTHENQSLVANDTENDMMKLVQGYYDALYNTEECPSGPIIDNVTDLCTLESGSELEENMLDVNSETENVARKSDTAHESPKVIEDKVIERPSSTLGDPGNFFASEIENDYMFLKKRMALKERSTDESDVVEEPRKYAQSRFARSMRHPKLG